MPSSIEAPPNDYLIRTAHHRRLSKNITSNQVVFLGDSMIEGLNTSAAIPSAINFGIGNDRISWMLDRMSGYQNLDKAKAWVFGIGINDLMNSSEHDQELALEALQHKFQTDKEIYLLAVLPVTEERSDKLNNLNLKVTAINVRLQSIAESSANVHFIPAPPKLLSQPGALNNLAHDGDGLHLNQLGYAIWIAHLNDKLGSL